MRTYLVTHQQDYSAVHAENFAEAVEKAKRMFGDYDSITHIARKDNRLNLSEELRLAMFEQDRKVKQ